MLTTMETAQGPLRRLEPSGHPQRSLEVCVPLVCGHWRPRAGCRGDFSLARASAVRRELGSDTGQREPVGAVRQILASPTCWISGQRAVLPERPFRTMVRVYGTWLPGGFTRLLAIEQKHSGWTDAGRETWI